MLWVVAFHIIFVVTWFSGLFYLPRLFVYHAMTTDAISFERFKVMERKLFYGITTPSGILATLFGIWALSYNFQGYLSQPWMHLKLSLVALLWVFHIFCGKYVHDFKENQNRHTHLFYRWFNEVPTLLLFTIVILVVVKPILR
jgi:putative membrane protein